MNNSLTQTLGAWNDAFAEAMFKVSILGIPQETVNTFVDCTSLIS